MISMIMQGIVIRAKHIKNSCPKWWWPIQRFVIPDIIATAPIRLMVTIVTICLCSMFFAAHNMWRAHSFASIDCQSCQIQIHVSIISSPLILLIRFQSYISRGDLYVYVANAIITKATIILMAGDCSFYNHLRTFYCRI